jgi:5-methylcytosine-specific restriction endonuclease McrA
MSGSINRRKKRNTNGRKKGKRGKKSIPKAVREQCWLKTFGEKYKSKCYVSWCKNEINVFDYHVGHNVPESNGGTLSLDNLFPICARCNLSMSNNYTIQQWSQMGQNQKKCCIIC